MTESQSSTASTPPLVFISHSHKDQEWEDRLRSHLKTAEDAGRIKVWDDKHINVDDVWNAEIESAIEQASVAVLLISPDYLSSDLLTRQEGPYLLKRQQESRNLRIFPIIIRPSNWKEIAWLRPMELFTFDTNPIEEHSPEVQEELLREAADAIVKAAAGEPVTPPQPTSKARTSPPDFIAGPAGLGLEGLINNIVTLGMSDEVKEILRRAGILATMTGKQPFGVTSYCLLFAIAELGRERSTSFKSSAFFWQQLVATGVEAYRVALRRTFPAARYASSDATISFQDQTEDVNSITHNVQEILRLAEKISLQTLPPSASQSATPPEYIHSRHLLAALLTYRPERGRSGAMGRLAMIVPDVLPLQQHFLDYLVSAAPQDNLDAWHTILIPKEEKNENTETATPDSETIPSPATTREPAIGIAAENGSQTQLAGFLADYWQGEDLLDITPDVNAFAALVAAWSVEPPLSIGLFGDWGSGKSHFMRQMKLRVEQLSRQARKSGRLQNQIGYYKNIVQIEFNAWHYIEGNLWASLVEHIFTHLKISEDDNEDEVEKRRQALMEKLGVQQKLRAQVDERKEQLKAEESKARDRAEKARQDRNDKSEELKQLSNTLKKEVIDQLNVPINFSESQKDTLKQLGVKEKDLTSAAELNKTYLAVKGFWGRLRAQAKLFQNDKSRTRQVAAAITLLAIPLLVGLTGKWLMNFYHLRTEQHFSRFYPALASALSFLLTFAVNAKPYLQQFKEAFVWLEEENEKIDAERQKVINKLDGEVEKLTRQYQDAKQQADTLSKEVEILETQIENTTASKILAQFIEDRAAANDYRRHLGVLALIRRDFEQLAKLFTKQRAEEFVEKEEKERQDQCENPSDNNKINRIILYIDDLDRCPPERVVQVLQAIHLLLAFPLFVVVVGVDARWVTRSLQESYEWLRVETDDEPEENKPGKREFRGATPHDYLEKIFQIPFWLKPMGETACENFIEGLTKDKRISSNGTQSNDTPGAVTATKLSNPATDTAETVPAQLASAQTTAQPGNSPERRLQQAVGEASANAIAAADQTNNLAEAAPSEDINPLAAVTTTIQVTNGVTAEQSANEENAETEVDLHPQSLMFSDAEISYMKEMAPLISRSPRAVKRFLNCYRLIKVGLPPEQLTSFLGEDGQHGEYKTVMILLGIITGAPSISIYFIEALETLKGNTGTLHEFLDQLAQNSEISQQTDWPRVRNFLTNHLARGKDSALALQSLLAVAPRVSRYSFKVSRAETVPRQSAQRDSQKMA